ncbi:putative disease resistance protein RGA1 [Spinacia oleracea]|uniref:Disease resistance protein RGA1 n=1 Tax=Spinacia oleracea TaxID=3562 RepID=A0ABM3RGZ7_SPIOL|nr:putative disease resistance protein RGA1 [Spinacia oleracea]
MEIGPLISVAQTLLAALQCTELKEIFSILGYKPKLDSLQQTVSTIRAVLRDAEAKQDLSYAAQLWIEELKNAVYDADDLLDEFVTVAEQKYLVLEGVGGNLSNKVNLFFSRLNPLVVAYNMSQGVKMIRKKLNDIASNHTQFGFSVDYQPSRRKREETCSYVFADNIIGREDDVERIVARLLDSNVSQDVSILPIVGVGGLGKTALAQLVYNDERVKNEFTLRLWTCVSDQDQEQLDIKEILGRILESVTGQKHDGSSVMDQVQNKLQAHLEGKNYLLVLDDVWTENRDEWLKMVQFLMGCQRGSWIVVTTRSRETARVIGNGPAYELQGLSEGNSWCLFERLAFQQVEEQANPSEELLKIGLEIVKQCSNVPLAIRVAGSLLYGQDKNKWLSFKEIGLTKVKRGGQSIIPILKLSYNQLESPLKSCFSYCALFPKDFEIEKEMLISLWSAQGYIVPLDECQSLEDAGDEYFSILLQRCFFQNIKKDEYGGIISCKIHDLMHDIAQEVAGKDICAMNFITGNLDKKTRHLSLMRRKQHKPSFFTKTQIRSYLQVGGRDTLHVDKILESYMCLRALDLKKSDIKSLPATIGKLLHLRYLDLSGNNGLEVFPKSITQLHNLQTLKLRWCDRLKELPKDLSKLAKLRLLDIKGCNELTYMPSGMDKLTGLCSLNVFVVGQENSSSKQYFHQLEELKALMNLKGHLTVRIRIPKNVAYVQKTCKQGYLSSKELLNHIRFTCEHLEVDGRVNYEEELLENMLPHSNLKGLELVGYYGRRMPSWAREDKLRDLLPNLVKIELVDCCELQYLPPLEKLCYLKSLVLESMINLEYIENTSSSSYTTPSVSELSFFPSLEILQLYDLPKLKGWSKGNTSSCSNGQAYSCLSPLFPRLSLLWISGCRDLTFIPLCPAVESLSLYNFNERLSIMKFQDDLKEGFGSENSRHAKLRFISTDNAKFLKLLPMEAYQCLNKIRICRDTELESLSEVEEVLQSCSSSLRYFEVFDCPSLKSLSGGLEHLTALETLSIEHAHNLTIKQEIQGGDNGMISLPQSLRYLRFIDLPKVVNLPKGMHYLTNLQYVIIRNCKGLKSLPESLHSMTSLRKLEI